MGTYGNATRPIGTKMNKKWMWRFQVDQYLKRVLDFVPWVHFMRSVQSKQWKKSTEGTHTGTVSHPKYCSDDSSIISENSWKEMLLITREKWNMCMKYRLNTRNMILA